MSMRPPPSRNTYLPRHGPSKSVSQLPSLLKPTARSSASTFGHSRHGSVVQTAVTPQPVTASMPTTPAASTLLRPSLQSLLLTNLRLLNLDTLQDWPNLTPKSFTSQDQKTRVRAFEWTLYQLFSVFSPSQTSDKLQPFFPPLEPLQSLNLRAALYRCLSDLKKDGVLGREVIMRKTMLDECKGEKLLEVLVLFSTAVLRHCQRDVKRRAGNSLANGRHMSVGRVVASEPTLSAKQRGSLIPLSLAHRATLARGLERRNERRVGYAAFAEVLTQKAAELERRRETCGQCMAPELSSGEELMLLRQIQANWPGGNSAWSEALLRGDNDNGGDEILKRDFQEIWHVMVEGGDLRPREGADSGLLADLEQRVAAQQARMSRWKAYRQRITGLAGSSLRNQQSDDAVRSRGASTFEFDHHQHLNFTNAGVLNDKIQSASLSNDNAYVGIIAKMNADLAAVIQRKRSSGPTGMIDLPGSDRKGSSTVQINQPPSRLVRIPSSSLSNGTSTKEFQPTRKFSPASFFSPLKSQLDQVENHDETADLSLTDVLENMNFSDSAHRSEEIPAEAAFQLEVKGFPKVREINSSENRCLGETSRMKHVAKRSTPSNIASSPDNVSEIPPSLTLMERTRMSITQSDPSAEGRIEQAATTTTQDQASTIMSITAAGADELKDEARRQTLAERTRQSMAFAFKVNEQIDDDAPLRPRKVRNSLLPKKPRQSLPQRPINQFETPKKLVAPLAELAEVGEEEPAEICNDDQSPDGDPNLLQAARQIKRIATPTEVLFSPDANVDSVFRSRPKMRMSPVLPPQEGFVEVGEMLSDGEGEGIIQSSPSRRRAWL